MANLTSPPKATASKASGQILEFRDYWFWLVVAGLLLMLIYALSAILLPFIAAALLAYMVEPLVARAGTKFSMPRVMSALLVLLAIAVIILIGVLLILPLFRQEVIPIMGNMHSIPERVIVLLSSYFPSIDWSDYFHPDVIKNFIMEQQDLVKSVLKSLQNAVLKGGGNAITFIANILLFPVALFYFILAWPKFSATSKNLLPPQIRNNVLLMLKEVDSVLGEYLHGQILLMLALAVFYSITLSLSGLEHGFLIGIITGIFVLIPFVGFAIGLFIALAMVLISGDSTLLIWVGVIYTAGQILESYILTPYLVGERIGLHPLAVIFALLAFWQLLGFMGVLLALPASAVLLVLLRHFHRHYIKSKLYQLS